MRAFLAPSALLLLTCGFLAVSYTYPAQSRAMPVLVGWLMVLLLLLDLASRTTTPAGRALLLRLNPAASAPPTGEGGQRSVRPILLIVLFGIALALLGTTIAVPAYVAVAMRVHGRHSIATATAAALGTLLFVYGLFTVLLKLPLYPGLLFGGDF